jgi:saccharopine dehydrogenase (NAD+, L-lysine forming)
MKGQTCVGVLARGLKDGQPRACYIYNVTDHQTAYAELGVQATAYQTGIPPVIAARLIHQGRWSGPGVRSPEEFDPDPFLECLAREGMPWKVRDDTPPTVSPKLPARPSREVMAA